MVLNIFLKFFSSFFKLVFNFLKFPFKALFGFFKSFIREKTLQILYRILILLGFVKAMDLDKIIPVRFLSPFDWWNIFSTHTVYFAVGMVILTLLLFRGLPSTNWIIGIFKPRFK